MKAVQTSSNVISLSMSVSEAVVLHALIATSEFAEDLEMIELREPEAKKVMSDVQQTLAPLIPTLGTAEYGPTVDRAFAEIDPGPFRG